MKYFNRGLLFVGFACYVSLDLILGSKPASVLDVAFFAWLAYCAVSERLEEMK